MPKCVSLPSKFTATWASGTIPLHGSLRLHVSWSGNSGSAPLSRIFCLRNKPNSSSTLPSTTYNVPGQMSWQLPTLAGRLIPATEPQNNVLQGCMHSILANVWCPRPLDMNSKVAGGKSGNTFLLHQDEGKQHCRVHHAHTHIPADGGKSHKRIELVGT